MNKKEIIERITQRHDRLEETIGRSARFRRQPLKTIWFYILVAMNRYLSLNVPIKTKTIWGDKMIAHETSAVGSIYFLGFYDVDITLFLLKNYNETGDFLDIGSNIGYYSLLANQIIQSGAKIVAFEPTPATFKLLKENSSAYPHIILEKIALSDTEGSMTFIDYGPRNAVFNSTKAQGHDFLKDKGEKIEVTTTTLDSYCTKNHLSPSFIKLDTEGTEASILRKGVATLKTHSPLILLEVGGGDAWKENTNKSLDILSELEYEFYNLDTEGNLLPHIRQNSYSYANLVCIPKSKLPKYA